MALESLSPAASKLLRYKVDHWAFLSECVWTLDQTDKYIPVKQYPAIDPSKKDYLKWISNVIVSEKLLALVKHRRMIITWTVCSLWLWDAMFMEGRFNVLLSKNEEDSDDLVKKCKFIYDNIPEAILPVKPIGEYKYTEFSFKEIDSRIKGFAMGTDRLRQYTCSRIAADEIAFWQRAEEAFTSMKPTLEGGGQVILLSTRYPGFFQSLVLDKLEST